MTQHNPTYYEKRLLPHERIYVLKASKIAAVDTTEALNELREALENMGGDWIFDDSAAQIAQEEKGRSAAKEFSLKRILEYGLLELPPPEEKIVVPGSRITLNIGSDSDVYDVVTRRLPGMPQDPEVLATLSVQSALGQAVLGKMVADEIHWQLADERTLSGVITAVDQVAQSAFYNKM